MSEHRKTETERLFDVLIESFRQYRARENDQRYIDIITLARDAGVDIKDASYLLTHAQNMGRVETECGRLIRRKRNPAMICITPAGQKWYDERFSANGSRQEK